MEKRRLLRNFYTNPTLLVAKNLLGKYIVRKIGKRELWGKIIETEAYIGPQDKASHAYLPREKFRPISKLRLNSLFGKKYKVNTNKLYRNFLRSEGKITPRNKAEYLIGGHIYIYLVYGMHWQLNISTYKQGKPECVLIRALDLGKLADGPGKLCRYLKLDKSFYGEDVTKSKRIWLEDRGEKIKPSQILATKRIGIDYAGPYWSKRKWRFLLKNH